MKTKTQKKADIRLISTTSGEEVENDVDLNNYFSNQAVSPVDFISAVHTMEKYCDVFIEIGPGKVLSGLVSNISRKIASFPAEMNPEDDFSINTLLANVFVLGCDVKTEYLYHDRLIRNFVPAREKSFLINPLERPFPDHLQDQSEPANVSTRTD